ncbi:MAG: ACP S-malonyltransferase [Mariprofundaceae bacterium]|nr:ACP S-malonyltransferase [Mariprofundaceae bacterium]
MSSDVVFFFPGQGSQSKGMLADFIAAETVVSDTFQEASDVLGYDMAALVSEDAETKLDQTEYTQPALLTASTALARLWTERGGLMPSQVAGHSLGEYSALVAAGALEFADAVALVAFRGQVMSKAVPAGVGKMAAIIGLDDVVITDLCGQVSDDVSKVWAANFNCPGQLVVAGHAAAVERLMLAAKEAGAKRALPLAVSAPSHTPLMQDAADAMQEKLAGITVNVPVCPVWSNARATTLTEAADIRAALVEQLISPVRWTETVQQLSAQGVSAAVEMGPGKVLAGLVRRVDKNIKVASVLTSDLLDQAIAASETEGEST